jgi:hypothetical protein
LVLAVKGFSMWTLTETPVAILGLTAQQSPLRLLVLRAEELAWVLAEELAVLLRRESEILNILAVRVKADIIIVV